MKKLRLWPPVRLFYFVLLQNIMESSPLTIFLFLVVFCRLEGENRAKAGRERKGKGSVLLVCCLAGRDYAITDQRGFLVLCTGHIYILRYPQILSRSYKLLFFLQRQEEIADQHYHQTLR